MRITKYGHSCLFIEEAHCRILIDPGVFCFEGTTLKPEDIPPCDVLLLTHEHQDHTYPPALKIILQKSQPLILTNASVQKVLREHGITSEVLKRGEERVVKGVSVGGVAVRGIACDHAFIGDFAPTVENIGFLIAGRLFHPGDCVAPLEPVTAEILAVPVTAPWMAVREGIDFLKKMNPKFAIPIHDGIVTHHERLWHRLVQRGIEGTSIQFVPLAVGVPREF